METSILPVKPGTLNDEDKALLREAGVVVIEHDNPEELRLLRPEADMQASDMLKCAMQALVCGYAGDAVKAEFTRSVAKVLLAC